MEGNLSSGYIDALPCDCAGMLDSNWDAQVKKKLEEVKNKKEASNPDDYLPDGIDRRCGCGLVWTQV